MVIVIICDSKGSYRHYVSKAGRPLELERSVGGTYPKEAYGIIATWCLTNIQR